MKGGARSSEKDYVAMAMRAGVSKQDIMLLV